MYRHANSFFRKTPSCKQFFSDFFLTTFGHKKDFSLLLPSIIIYSNILRRRPTNWKKRNLQSGSKSSNHCLRSLPIDTSELIFYVLWDVQYDNWRQWREKPLLYKTLAILISTPQLAEVKSIWQAIRKRSSRLFGFRSSGVLILFDDVPTRQSTRTITPVVPPVKGGTLLWLLLP